MSTRQKTNIPEEERTEENELIHTEASLPQTEPENSSDADLQAEGSGPVNPEPALPQTEQEQFKDAAVPAEDAEMQVGQDALSHTGPELPAEGSGAENPESALPQTEPEHLSDADLQAEENGLIHDEVAQPQTEPEQFKDAADPAEGFGIPGIQKPVSQADAKEAKKPRRRKKNDPEASQSNAESPEASGSTDSGTPKTKTAGKKRAASGSSPRILSINDRLEVETEAEKAQNDLLDLLESQKTGRILTGTIQGVERSEDNPNHSFAVIYHGDFKVIIPAEEAVEPPDDLRGRSESDVMHYMLTKRLGAEVDYIVRGINPKAGIAAASRLEAMRAKRKRYYYGTDRDGNNLIYSGVSAEARVISVIRAGIFVDLFGLEIYIPLRELSYQRWMDASGYFQPGQRILVKVLDVTRIDRNHIRATASVKQAGENPYEKALRRYSVGSRYVGTVSMVDANGVFVALDSGIDCLCSYPKRGRPPRGACVTVRILGINKETNRIWGAITHIAMPH
ncbi:MAG: S1 RNA-binding domain-containing protein [Oscillospiraceae bacterium]